MFGEISIYRILNIWLRQLFVSQSSDVEQFSVPRFCLHLQKLLCDYENNNISIF